MVGSKENSKFDLEVRGLTPSSNFSLKSYFNSLTILGSSCKRAITTKMLSYYKLESVFWLKRESYHIEFSESISRVKHVSTR